MICGNTSDFIDHPLPKRFVSAHAVAILELKKWGKEKSRGANTNVYLAW